MESLEGKLETGAADTLLVSPSAVRMVVFISMVMLLNANQCCSLLLGFFVQEAFLSASWPQLPVFLPSENEEHLLVFCSSNCSSTMLMVLAPSTLSEEGRKSFSLHCWHCPSVFSPVTLFLSSTFFAREENYRCQTSFLLTQSVLWKSNLLSSLSSPFTSTP